MADERKKNTAPAEAADTWPRSEHIRAAYTLYGQPAWLIETVLAGEQGDTFSREQVEHLIETFLAHQVKAD